MNLEDIIPSEIGHIQQGKKTFMISLTGGNFKRQKHRSREKNDGYQGGKVWETGKLWSESTKLGLRRMNKSRLLTYSMMTIVNNTVLNPGNVVAR